MNIIIYKQINKVKCEFQFKNIQGAISDVTHLCTALQ